MTAKLDWDEVAISKFWDYYSQFPGAYFGEQNGDNILNMVSSHIDEGSKVLDYGCGSGYMMKCFMEKNHEVYGCDLSSETIESVRKKFVDEANFGGAYKTDELFAQGVFFDAVLMTELVEHINVETFSEILENIKRVLRPGGRIFITTPNQEDLSIETVFCPCCDHTFHRWQHVMSWSSQSLSKFLLERSFEFVITVETDFSNQIRRGLSKYWAKEFLYRFKLRKYPHLYVTATLL